MEEELITFFFYFEKEIDAKGLSFLIEKKGFYVSNIRHDDYEGTPLWSVIACKFIISDGELDYLMDVLDIYAEGFDGVYDGYERILP
ncbi:MAG: ribonuclease E inhibitor RraB [bacterium]|nr:ribonuclease E inhibitor RraB [bacterium]